MRGYSKLTKDERRTVRLAGQLDPDLRKSLVAMRATYLTPDAFQADIEALFAELTVCFEQGHLEYLRRRLEALYECWRLGLVVPP